MATDPTPLKVQRRKASDLDTCFTDTPIPSNHPKLVTANLHCLIKIA